MAKPKQPHTVDSIRHTDRKRLNIPSAEHQPIMTKDEQKPVPVVYEHRNRGLDPQLVWRGKDEQEDLHVPAPPLYIQERVHSRVLIDDLMRQTKSRKEEDSPQMDLFADFNGLPDEKAKTEFYRHDANWSNRMILGDSLQVMASLAEREGLRGKVQCIYFDPPYGIRFNSNFQWSTTSRDVKDGKKEHITREPEQVKAFRDTWRDGIHSYLSYLRDRLTVARDLLTDSGSIFVQISSENVHRVRVLLDEVFSEDNFVTEIVVKKKGSQKSGLLSPVNDFILWYSKSPRTSGTVKYHKLYTKRDIDSETVNEFSRVELANREFINLKSYKKIDFGVFPEKVNIEFPGGQLFGTWPIFNGGESANQMAPVSMNGRLFTPPKGCCWRHTSLKKDEEYTGMDRIRMSNRLVELRTSLRYKRYLSDFPYRSISNWWDGFGGPSNLIYIVQTNERIIQRCILMTTDPGDLVIDPTCGSGTTAYVAEEWGRRWITIDTSRVALALARSRIMGARYPYYFLADSVDGQIKESELTRSAASTLPTYENIKHGFVYERSPHITSTLIANNSEIDVIWDNFQKILEPLREKLNSLLKQSWEEWEIPRDSQDSWSETAKKAHSEWWKNRIRRQKEIDDSIAAKADYEYLYDKPYEDKKTVRVAGPFTVESVSPHRYLGVDEHDHVIDPPKAPDFAQMILENLKSAGIQQVRKENKIDFSSLTGWPGKMICAEGRYDDGSAVKRAAIFIGPEFGSVSRADLVSAAREAADADFDVLVACAFNYEAHVTDFNKLGRVPILKARMNADLHMADDLKNTGAGNLFVIFGEPDIKISDAGDGRVQVEIRGVDVFDPKLGEVRSHDQDGIACWFIDTDYNEESFFIRHSYFLGANDPYKALKRTLKAEIDQEAWESLHSAVSRPFAKPSSGRIAVKVINHLGDEVMKVFRVS